MRVGANHGEATQPSEASAERRGECFIAIPQHSAPLRLCERFLSIALCAVELFFRLFAARAKPVGWEILERDTFMFGGIVDIAADGASVFASRRLEDDFTRRNDGRRIVEIDDALLRVAFQRFGRVGAKIHGRTGAAEGTNAVESFARSGLVLKDDGKPVLVERDIGVGNITVDEIEESVRLNGDDAIARGVARRRDVRHARRDALRGGELVIGAVGERRHGRVVGLDFVRLGFCCGADDLGVRERAQFAGVIEVLVRDENLRNLLRLVAEIGERIKVRLDLCADEDRSVRICRRIGIFGGKPGIDENDLATSVNNPVLETGTT